MKFTTEEAESPTGEGRGGVCCEINLLHAKEHKKLSHRRFYMPSWLLSTFEYLCCIGGTSFL
jgi:hypothetical protein